MSKMEDLEEVYEYVSDEGPVTAPEVSEEFGFSPRSARRRLNRLTEEGRVDRERSNSGAYRYHAVGVGWDAEDVQAEVDVDTNTAHVLAEQFEDFEDMASYYEHHGGFAGLPGIYASQAEKLGVAMGDTLSGGPDETHEPRVEDPGTGVEAPDWGGHSLLIGADRSYLRLGDLNGDPEGKVLASLRDSIRVRSLSMRYTTAPRRDEVELVTRRVGTEDIENVSPNDLIRGLEDALNDLPAPFHVLYEDGPLTGEAARSIRTELSIRQKEAAAAIDRDPAALSRWERDKDNLLPGAVDRLKTYLRDEYEERAGTSAVSPSWLLPDGWERDTAAEWLSFDSADGYRIEVTPETPSREDAMGTEASPRDEFSITARVGEEFVGTLRTALNGRSVAIEAAFSVMEEYPEGDISIEEFARFRVREYRHRRCGGTSLIPGRADRIRTFKCPHCPETFTPSDEEVVGDAVVEAHPGDVDAVDSIEDHRVVQRMSETRYSPDTDLAQCPECGGHTEFRTDRDRETITCEECGYEMRTEYYV